MMKERTDTIYKSKQLTDEQKRAAIMGPAAAQRAKREEFKKMREARGFAKDAVVQESKQKETEINDK